MIDSENASEKNLEYTGSLAKPVVDFFPENLHAANALDPVIHCICESVRTEKIFLLGTYPVFPESFGVEFDLLVLVDSGYKRPMHELESLILNRCHDFAMVSTSVHKIETINHLLKQANIFFGSLCDPENLLFDNGQAPLCKSAMQHLNPNWDCLRNEFSSLFAKAKSFLLGAISYRISGDNQLAAFMLHQTVEHALNAFLIPLIGYRLQTHNLNKLFLYARRISRNFYTIFPRNTDAEIQLYQTLHKAYIYGRYKNNFQVGQETIQILINRATAILEMTELIFYEKIDELRNSRNGIA